jgi:hypothetical protein
MAYTKQQIITALESSMGAVYLAAERLGCSHNTIAAWIKRSPDVAAVQERWRGKLLDAAETQLYRKVQSGDNWAIGFALGKLGHARGYKDKQELDVKGDVTVEIKWVEDDTANNDQAAEDAPQAGGDLPPSGTV